MKNEYVPFVSKILAVKKHTDLEYTFTMSYEGDVKPGQFFEVSLPKYGEAPISVSGIGEGSIDFTIRKVGKVTNEIFSSYVGDTIFLRGPYGNGFDIEDYKDKEVLIVAGGTGLSPVRGIVDYIARHMDEVKSATLICGFKSKDDVLFKEDIERWKQSMNVVQTVDKADEDYDGPVGMVTKFIPDVVFEQIENAACIVVGPPIMMKFVVQEFKKLQVQDDQIWISQERKMCCGIGKCGHCRIDDTYICLDGPVFVYTKGKDLID